LRVWNRGKQITWTLPDVWGESLAGISPQAGRMSVWCLPIQQSPQTTKCEICGREIEQLNRSGRLARVCRSCLTRTPEKRAA